MNKKDIGPLYAKSSNGKIKVWKALVNDNILYTTHGYLDGKQTTSQKEIKGKNIGKKNETTPFEQACSDAQSKYNKKIDSGYVIDLDNVDNIIELPMLANHYKNKKHNVTWPCYVSPKLDGFRLISKKENDSIIYRSRKNKEYTNLSHLDKNVSMLIDEIKFADGEGFNPNLPLQDIAAAIKKQNENTETIEYWIFDVVDTTKDFQDRYKIITNFFDKYSDGINEYGFRTFGKIVEVPNYEINNEEELEAKHKEFIEAGFEGTMVRNKLGKYILIHRSNNLLKRKDFLEDEFKIVGGKEATGDDVGTVVFTCITKEGKEFDVRPKGSRNKRKIWLNNLDNIIGKELTVRFQMWSKDLVPCQLRGICIRDYED